MKRFLFALLLFPLLYVSAQPQQKNEQITVDGIKRDFITYLPDINATGLPVIISLHGNLGTPEGQLKLADFRPLAIREKFMIVCPAGIDRSWNDGRATRANKKNVDDVHFINELITYILTTYKADAHRVYVTGMSNGGFMASRLACELSNRIAAVAIVAATMDKDVDYAPVKPIPVMYIHGTDDPIVPFEGGMIKKGAGGKIYGHEEALQKWASADNCNLKPIVTSLPQLVNDGTSVTKEEYTRGGAKRVVGYTITSGGHTWPGGPQYLPKFVVGISSKNFDACQAICDFFIQYHLK